MRNEIRHVGIVVNDLDESLYFWKKFFLFEIVVDQIEPAPYINQLLDLQFENLRTVKIKGKGNTVIELLKFDNLVVDNIWRGKLNSVGLTHIAITVDNIEELFKGLKKADFSPLSEILISPNKKVKVVFFKGPENLMLELVEDQTYL